MAAPGHAGRSFPALHAANPEKAPPYRRKA
jgi:hypothetical protein